MKRNRLRFDKILASCLQRDNARRLTQQSFYYHLSDGWKNHLKKGGVAYVLIEDVKIIGVLEISQFREEMNTFNQFTEIPVIYLLPGHIGKGLGCKLMNFAIDLLSTRNINKIAIWVLEKNAPAIKFYKKQGFVNSGEIKQHAATGLMEHLYIKNT